MGKTITNGPLEGGRGYVPTKNVIKKCGLYFRYGTFGGHRWTPNPWAAHHFEYTYKAEDMAQRIPCAEHVLLALVEVAHTDG